MSAELLLDFDRREGEPTPDSARLHAIIVARMARAGYRVATWVFEPSTSGWHARVTLDPSPESPMEIVALQAIAGSDPLREACNVQRARTLDRSGYFAAKLLHNLWTSDERATALVGTRIMRELVAMLETWMRGIEASPLGFWLDRWNTLYERREGK